MEKPEKHRNRWALGLSVTLSLFIFASFAFYKGYVGFEIEGGVSPTRQVASPAVAVEEVSSPLQNSKKILKDAFGEIEKQYDSFKDSVSSVIVPFITGIEIYERE